ncbi:MetQ/NlpA family ABC transporter substrate-binding protein [Zhaonella formicivorans]|uniref:MetQ/NlpA family ABC transporter substrate-binding protein n=1 Tax=Zhaonella formicivorans TaxID=2528593 RepID=UPI0010D0BA36|nr:MetQ/NlpA family ABC transporter substrate-binding protein [Zhaonella formicivorans]
MRKKLWLLPALILLAVLAVGCGQDKVTQKKAENSVLKIGLLPVEDGLPLVLAEQKGYFAEQGLQVELVPFQSAVERDSALQSGELHGVVTDVVAAALLRDSGLDIKITTLTLGASPQEGRFAILAAPGKGFEKLADLKGKTIGISQNSIIEYVTDGLLKQAGIAPEEIQKIAVPKIPVRLEMLLNGQLDAATLPDPLATFAEFKGAKIIAADTATNLSQVVLVMTNNALQEKGEVMRRFFTAYSRAVAELNSSPEKYRQLLVEEARIPEPIKDIYQMPHFPEPQLPEEEVVEDVLMWLTSKGLLQKEITFDDMVETGLY